MFSLTEAEIAAFWPALEALGLARAKPRERIKPRRADSPNVLVVDDDDDIRDYATTVLRGAGYRVVGAASPSEALRQLGDQATIDLMFTDIVLPEIDGFKLAELAKRRHPGLRVLYASGYPESVLKEPIERYGRLLAKPYRATQLEQAVREATRAA
jgi:CheY-like chemotaxis protein